MRHRPRVAQSRLLLRLRIDFRLLVCVRLLLHVLHLPVLFGLLLQAFPIGCTHRLWLLLESALALLSRAAPGNARGGNGWCPLFA